MSERHPEPREPVTKAESQPDERDAPTEYGGVLGIVFVLILVVGAIYMIERMRHYATLGDCAFTRAPQCAELMKR